MSEPVAAGPEILFAEPGASWAWLLAGPASAVAMALLQKQAGGGFDLLVPLAFLVLVTGFLGLQVKATRVHTSVELTPETLREGTEVVPVSQIVEVYPDRPVSEKSGEPQHRWQSSRTLGELSGIPKGRTAIGLRLSNDRSVQAWARDHDGLREALNRLVGEPPR